MADIIDDITLAPSGDTGIIAAWTGTTDMLASVWIDGELVFSGLSFDGTARSVILPMRPGTPVFALDIVEYELGESVNGIATAPETHPVINWRVTDTAAVKSRVYGRHADDASETLLEDIPVTADKELYSWRLRLSRAHGWNWFRVMSVDSTGNESTISAWPFYVIDKPGDVSGIAVAGTAGVFSITLTA